MTRHRPSNPAQPPCAAQPERWFNRSDSTHALRECLACPLRSWCAGEALRLKASFGMWAGIFIQDNLTDVSELLGSITKMPSRPVPTPSEEPARPVVAPAGRHNAALAAVMARSSGHCEIMTQQCRLTFDTLGSRIPGRDPWTSEHPSEIYAVCRPCAAVTAAAEPEFMRRMGIVVDPPYEPGFTRFFWRQKHWVYLTGDSQILPLDDDLSTVTANGGP